MDQVFSHVFLLYSSHSTYGSRSANFYFFKELHNCVACILLVSFCTIAFGLNGFSIECDLLMLRTHYRLLLKCFGFFCIVLLLSQLCV